MAEKTVSTTSFAEKEKVDYKGKKLSIAMIGCGGISEIQLDVLKEMPEVEIVAGVDARSERLKVMEEKYGVKQLIPTGKRCSRRSSPTPFPSARQTVSTHRPPLTLRTPARTSSPKSPWP